MFVDYLRLSYLIPWGEETHPQHHVAALVAQRAKVCGEEKIDGSHRQVVASYPEGLRIVLDWGGSNLPIDLDDFLRRFKAYKTWTISRLDLADNLDHLTRAQVHHGQAKTVNHWNDLQTVGDQVIEVWTGCGIGKRGSAGSYFRAYDARKHKEGHAAKISRFGTYEFWRIEYELSREYFRRRGIGCFGELDAERLGRIWATETNKKGVFYEGTSEYHNLRETPIAVVEEEMAQESRYTLVERMVRKMDCKRLERLLGLVVERIEAQTGRRVLVHYEPQSGSQGGF